MSGPKVEHRFVACVPDAMEDRVVYIAVDFATVVHRCCCGCGNEVVTPLSPTDWTLTFDGETISLNPSIGNWSFECQSHYWIKQSRVRWAPRWSKEQIAMGRAYDLAAKGAPSDAEGATDVCSEVPAVGFWQAVRRWWSSRLE